MKKYLTLLGFLVYVVTYSQQQYSEQEPTANMEVGIYYQTGPGSNNSVLNWEYPYGTKLTVSGSACCRNFELLSTTYPYGEFKLRQWDPNGNQWTQWRSILMENKDGRIGVGTSNPLEKLHLKGTFAINDGGAGLPFKLWAGSVGETNHMRIGTDFGHYGDAALEIYQNYAGGDQRNPGKVIVNGKLGIGTNNPSKRLDVNGNIGAQEFIVVQKGGSYLLALNGQNHGYIAGRNSSFEHKFYITSNGTSYFNGGNLGIGTTTPDSKLTVKGKIHTQEVKVDLAGAVAPDYVFLDNYKLRTLEEVSLHIQEKGHLPNIPSAKQMEKEGVNLKEMNLKLLEKIEELTLYTIAQEEKIKEHEEQSNNLKAELKSEKQRINLLENKVNHILNQLQN